MCRYDCFFYHDCGHYGIELVTYCQEALFRAGMEGRMPLCRPSLFPAQPVVSGNVTEWQVIPVLWEGILGSCRDCVSQFVLPSMVYVRSGTARLLPPHDPDLFDPVALAPYLYVPRHAATVPELLGLADTFDQVLRCKQGPRIVFPWRLERTDWYGLAASLPWASQGMWEAGVDQRLPLRFVHDALGLWEGMTAQQKDLVVQKLGTSGVAAVKSVWERHCEARGMPWSQFTRAVQQVLMAMMDEVRKTSWVEDLVA